jgi:hypothetical protein
MSLHKVRPFPTCTRCGSELSGRFEKTIRRKDGSRVDVYKCPCGRGRRIER